MHTCVVADTNIYAGTDPEVFTLVWLPLMIHEAIIVR